MNRVTQHLLRPVFGTEGALAFRQLERQHTRTALTVGVLFIGIIVTIGFGSSLLSNIHDIDRWYRRTIPADYLIRSSMPDAGTVWPSPMARELRDELAHLEGVDENVGRINFVDVTVQGKLAKLIARDYPPERSLPLALVEGKEGEVRAGLQRGEVVLGTALAHRTGLRLGDDLELITKEGNRKLRIVGIAKEYTVGGLAFYASWDTADRLLALSGIHAFEVYVRPGEEEAAERSVRAFCSRKGLLVQSNAQLRSYVDNLVGSVEGFLWVLIALVFVVAALGIVNTLTMNVHEQTRELGVLRAIGLKRGQVRKLVVAQAAALGLLSILPGVLAGIGLAWLMNVATYPFSGHRVDLELKASFVAGCAGIALVIAVLASLLPARRAARLHIIEALHYE
jgi:putative ABC transport system permease protein